MVRVVSDMETKVWHRRSSRTTPSLSGSSEDARKKGIASETHGPLPPPRWPVDVPPRRERPQLHAVTGTLTHEFRHLYRTRIVLGLGPHSLRYPGSGIFGFVEVFVYCAISEWFIGFRFDADYK
jgi:hypothetical protein